MKTWTTQTRVAGAPEHVLDVLIPAARLSYSSRRTRNTSAGPMPRRSSPHEPHPHPPQETRRRQP
jgi:hypothetical protein